jgi:uncharacterized membrane protein
MLLGLMVLFGLISLICSIIVLIAAFQDEVWKGILSFVCGFYGLYYMVAEFQHEKKALIIIGSIGGGVIASILQTMAAAQALTEM